MFVVDGLCAHPRVARRVLSRQAGHDQPARLRALQRRLRRASTPGRATSSSGPPPTGTSARMPATWIAISLALFMEPQPGAELARAVEQAAARRLAWRAAAAADHGRSDQGRRSSRSPGAQTARTRSRAGANARRGSPEPDDRRWLRPGPATPPRRGPSGTTRSYGVTPTFPCAGRGSATRSSARPTVTPLPCPTIRGCPLSLRRLSSPDRCPGGAI